MILRRLTQSLKDQNWTAIAIEFVLLVLGVFLGIQVGNWNQQREQRSKADTFSARLREDLRHEQWAETRRIVYYRQVRKIANDTFTTPLNDRIFERAQNSEYRKLFRETVSFEVQSALSARCGDRLPRALDYSAIAHILDYPCTLDLPEAGIRDAVSALRAQPRLVPALQLRHADLGTAITDLSRTLARKARAR